ncbi:DUF4240 domain-containing protein [Paractinoplanes atraurantiacus]|uniref:DUF4240 domain-containing protein n=1 Tax=Paractinoplanes atraurantiacus TaxID=1036182 RepID=A0A285J9X4_9ACTN|nr:DUF4240 domain-containing protein [Actinoplanes atraurantiacus]SNY57110.1 Protein of unknown function [Actinoplanes atraurantiacus]
MTTTHSTRVPTEAEEARFWALIESAWAACGPGAARARQALLDRDQSGALTVESRLDTFLERLRSLSAGLSSAELTDLDRVAERLLFRIDREEIQEHTDGSDDGFLYCRGFILAAGRDFYYAVDADPARAVEDAECESMPYFFAHLHNERFGDFPDTGSGISRESATNPDGW